VIQANAANTSITGNKVVGGATGVWLSGAGCTSCQVRSNDISGFSSNGILDSGTGTIKAWNVVAGVAPEVTGSVTYDSASVPASSCVTSANQTLSGVASGTSICQINMPWPLEAGLIATGYATAANAVAIRVCNVTTVAIDPASRSFPFLCRNP
jgi:hypothetical protein